MSGPYGFLIETISQENQRTQSTASYLNGFTAQPLQNPINQHMIS